MGRLDENATDYYSEGWIRAVLEQELEVLSFSGGESNDIARELAPFVRRLCLKAHDRGALQNDARRSGGLPTRLGELVSGERILLRRALGIVSDLQRLEGEVRAVLDAYGSPQVVHSPVEKNPVIPENGKPIKD
jgi:hypothetical protein